MRKSAKKYICAHPRKLIPAKIYPNKVFSEFSYFANLFKILQIIAKYEKRGKYMLYCMSKHAITGLSLKLTELNLRLLQNSEPYLENKSFFEVKKIRSCLPFTCRVPLCIRKCSDKVFIKRFRDLLKAFFKNMYHLSFLKLTVL